MVDWGQNETGSSLWATTAVRGSRYLREVRVVWETVHVRTLSGAWTIDHERSKWKVTQNAVLDMDAPINAGGKPHKITYGEKWFDDLREAKAWAESWLQP